MAYLHGHISLVFLTKIIFVKYICRKQFSTCCRFTALRSWHLQLFGSRQILHVANDSILFTFYKYKAFTEYFGHHRHCIHLAGANRHRFFVLLNTNQSTFYIDLAID